MATLLSAYFATKHSTFGSTFRKTHFATLLCSLINAHYAANVPAFCSAHATALEEA